MLAGPALAHMVLATVFELKPAAIEEPADIADALCDLLLHGLLPRTETS
jgi:hypothetical protein